MTKRPPDVGDDQLDSAPDALDQATAARIRQVDWLAAGGLAELAESEDRAVVWR